MKRQMVLAAALVFPATAALAEGLTLAAGAGYRRPVAEAVAAFEGAGGSTVGQVYGNMGQVMGQARESGQIGMVCGDRSVLGTAEGLTFARFVPLGAGKLVVAYRKGIALAAPEAVAGDEITRVGIPDEKAAVYGKAGRQYLERSGLAASVDPRLVTVGTVPQVTAYLTTGEVDAGFINATDAIGAAETLGGWLPVDPALYDPIEIACGVLDEAAAGPFAAFLETPEARGILARNGL